MSTGEARMDREPASEKAVMAHVTVTINGRHYRMACEDGEESHLAELAVDLDRRVEQLRERFGEIGDHRLLVMAALTLSDQLNEAKRRIAQLQQELSGIQDARVIAADRSHATQAAVAAALNAAADRIERVTRSLNQSLGGEIAIG